MGRKPSNPNLPKRMLARKRRRKDGRVVVYYFFSGYQNGKRKEFPLGTDYLSAVQLWVKLAQERHHDQCVTFTQAAARYLQDVISKRGEETRKGASQAVRRLTQFFGSPDAPLDSIKPHHIRQYLNWRKDVKPSANNEVGYFSAIFNYARELGYTDAQNPSQGVKRFPRKPRGVYIEDALYKLVYQAADQEMKDLMDIAYLTGQRPVDVVGIHSNHIRDGVLHIRQQKTDAKLRFQISGQLSEILKRIDPPDGGYLFKSAKGGKLTRKTLSRRFLDLRLKLIDRHPELEDELRNFQFRDLRAKSATDIYLESDRVAAREQLGHTSETMTQTYIRKPKVQTPITKAPK